MGHDKRIRKLRMRRRQQRRRAREAWRSAPQCTRDAVLYTMTALVQRDLDRLLAGETLQPSDLLGAFLAGLQAARWAGRPREADVAAAQRTTDEET